MVILIITQKNLNNNQFINLLNSPTMSVVNFTYEETGTEGQGIA